MKNKIINILTLLLCMLAVAVFMLGMANSTRAADSTSYKLKCSWTQPGELKPGDKWEIGYSETVGGPFEILSEAAYTENKDQYKTEIENFDIPETGYFFAVRLVRGADHSKWSDVVFYTPLKTPIEFIIEVVRE
jgi:hypothetical protein